ELTSINGASTATLAMTTGTLTNSPTGTITSLVGTGGARNLDVALNNQGLVTVTQPLGMSPAANAVSTNSGTIAVSGGDLVLSQSGGSASFTNTGSVTIAAGRTWSIANGTLTANGGTVT